MSFACQACGASGENEFHFPGCPTRHRITGVTIEADSVVVKGTDFDALCGLAADNGRLRKEMSLAEERLANYAQENAALREFVSRFKELLDLDPENHPGTDLGRLILEVEEFDLHPSDNVA